MHSLGTIRVILSKHYSDLVRALSPVSMYVCDLFRTCLKSRVQKQGLMFIFKTGYAIPSLNLSGRQEIP